LLDVLEAAHIRPYLGENDNHPENGLLLRADIYTLFDLDLLGTEPDTLRVRIHPTACAAYGQLEGQVLACPMHRACRAALLWRWRFQAHLAGTGGAPALQG
jgi:hypothetical protein